VANPNKTVFMLLNNKIIGNDAVIKIGQIAIKQEHNAKLLGMNKNDKQKW
jgi:hypothetical protein